MSYSVDSFKSYLTEIARYPLLTVEQEIQLSRQVEAGRQLSGKEELSSADRRIARTAERAKHKLINCNLRLVVSVAKQYTRRLNGSSMELMDLIQEGALGLHRAVELFDGTKGYKFSTYAYWWIKQAITRGIDTKERLIRVPQHGLDTVYRVVRFQKDYMQRHGRMPTLQVMAEENDVSPEYLEMLMSRNSWHRSLDALAIEDGSPVMDLIPDISSLDAQQDLLEKEEKQVMLSLALDCLNEAELDMITKRYGLKGSPPMSLSGIAAEGGITRESIRQRLLQAHTKMRLKLNTARYV